MLANTVSNQEWRPIFYWRHSDSIWMIQCERTWCICSLISRRTPDKTANLEWKRILFINFVANHWLFAMCNYKPAYVTLNLFAQIVLINIKLVQKIHWRCMACGCFSFEYMNMLIIRNGYSWAMWLRLIQLVSRLLCCNYMCIECSVSNNNLSPDMFSH